MQIASKGPNAAHSASRRIFTALNWDICTIFAFYDHNEWFGTVLFLLHNKVLSRYILVANLFMLSVAVIMIGVCFRHKFTIEPPRSVDPVKLVIKYAWKHKYPERPSSFTYTDDPNTTSRLDFGKKRYGGPFTSQ